MIKTKQLVREYVWFPQMDHLIEQTVRKCPECQANTDNTKHAPTQMSKMPIEPWEELSIDFYGPLRNGKYLLVLIDDHSRYPVVKCINSTAATSVIPCLNQILAMFGVPRKIRSDNGPPFNSHA